MPFRNDSLNWGVTAKTFHWSIATLVFVEFALGWLAVVWPLTPTKLYLFIWHKSLGMVVLLLVVMRLIWRLFNPRPLFPVSVARWERVTAETVHGLFYAVLILLPFSGWLLNSATGVPFKIFGWFKLPELVAPSRPLMGIMIDAHILLGWALISLLAIHILAALRHHWFRQDVTLKRMLPFVRIRESNLHV
ncbi:MAG: cytochrome b [Gammaproteobacteria bacterium]